MEKENPIEKAQRYVEKAKQVLQENGEYDSELKAYQNQKAVRTAGRSLWNAVEAMVNAVFNVRNEQCPNPFVKDYVRVVAQHDRRLSTLVEASYDTLWSGMGDLGLQSKPICDAGFRIANDIIKACAKMLPKQPNNASLHSRRAKLLSLHPTPLTPTPTLQANLI